MITSPQVQNKVDDQADRDDQRDFVHSFARGLEIIRAFTRRRPRMTMAEVANATGMTRAATRRFLITLRHEGYVESDGKYYWLRPKVMELGLSALSAMNMSDVAQPIMNCLSNKVGESIFAAVLDGQSVIYVARAEYSARVISIGIHIGSRAPAHSASTGRVLLAAMSDDDLHGYLEGVNVVPTTPYTQTSLIKLREIIEETRRQGWSLVDQEHEIGLRSISVPIRNRIGTTVAALNVCCPTPRWTLEAMQSRLLAELLEASARISEGLSDHGFA